MAHYTWGNFPGISSDAWAYSLAKMQITVTDATTKNNLWQAIASQKIRDPEKFRSKLKENVDKFIQKTMKSFPPKK
jgi:CRISPR/Cas system-associated endonuclease Cas1